MVFLVPMLYVIYVRKSKPLFVPEVCIIIICFTQIPMEFEDLGKHCAYCQQKDILPFQCNCCKEYYCLEHIRRDAHKCPKANANDNTVIICTKCDQPIQLLADVDASILVCIICSLFCSRWKNIYGLTAILV